MRHPIIAVGLVIAASAALGGCQSASCSNDIVKARPSPDGKQTLWLYVRDCGATTGFSTHIALLDGDAPPTEGGNIAVADDDHGAVKTDGANHQLLGMDIRWTGDKGAAVAVPTGARTFKTEDRLGNVTINYDEVSTE